MADSTETILALLNRLDGKVDGITAVQRDHAEVLNDHIRRTEALEEQTSLIRQDVAPIKQHVAVFGALAKGIGALLALAGTVAGIWSAWT